jgi:SAM-dependent methyltransferase
MVTRVGWEALADWRDQRMGEEGDLWHRAIIDPALRRLVGPVRGLRVLDLACGNGYLTRRWAREGAKRAVGIDTSRRSLSFARRRERSRPSGAEFLRRDAGRLTGLGNRSFDIVAANMALMDIRDLRPGLREWARVLAPEGRFVFSISHPCFDLDDRSAWVVERARDENGVSKELLWRKVRQYREERAVRVPWRISESETGFTVSYHRTLSTYSGLLRSAGFCILRMEEPAPLPEAVRDSPQGRFMLEVPLHLVVEARLYPGRARRPRRPASRRSARTPRTTGLRSGSGVRSGRSGSPRRGSIAGS